MKPIKKIVVTLIFLMGFLICFGQEKENKPSSSSPEMGETSKSTIKRLATTVEPNRKFSYPERELDYLMHIWKGEYDNVEQLGFDKIQKKEGVNAKEHDRVHVSIRQFQNSNFGVGAVYLEEYRENNKNVITRQSIYQLLPEDQEKAIKIKVFHFKEKKPILAKGDSFDVISKLTPTSNLLKDGCSMILRRNGDGFLAKTIAESCTVKEAKEYQFSISENAFNFSDDKQKSAYQLEKARCFTCMIDFPNETNGRSTITKHYIDILDQGGSFKFEYPDGRNMLLGMRNTWSFGMHRETFVIYILDQKTNKTLIYSWGNPGADRIGFNPGWIRVQCDIKTTRNVKLQQELRPGS
ncbi:CpcT/CpeT family chromophore lyase [uncultured Maribacter sp.]|uniref:CpcT/CpeT family chromophore lyase n=1 Tax=uncultured Maribacter sp. TaxID=431308 RepID=UPI00261CA652|nr:CpcT/CpeT family chromophore lyase [uncultured Maribacter sp.]